MKESTAKYNRDILLLLLFYVLLSTTKALIAILFMKTVQVMPDALTLSEIARTIAQNHKIGYYFGHPLGNEPLYPIFISAAFLFHNMLHSYDFIKLFNGFFSSLIIFPLFFLAKELLNRKSALFIAVITGLLPASNSYALNILAENVYFPLFLTSIYFLYKYETEKRSYFAAFSGIFMGLSFLAKPPGISLFAGYFLYILFISFTVRGNNILDKIKSIMISLNERRVIFIISALLILSWLIRNGHFFGFSIMGMLHYHHGEASGFLHMHISYLLLAYLILEHISLMAISSGLVPFLFFLYVIWMSFKKFPSMNEDERKKFEKVKKLLGILIFPLILLLVIASKQSELMVYIANTNRLLGRHIVVIMPLIFLMGAIGFDMLNKHKDLKSLRIVTILSSLIIILVAIFSIDKYITSQTIIGSPGDLFLYIFKSSSVPILDKLHLVLLPPLFVKVFIILIFLFYIFIQFKYKLSLKFFFTTFILFLLLANTYAIAGNTGLDRWVVGISKIPSFLAEHKISSKKIIVSSSISKNAGFIMQMKFWLGDNFTKKNIFPKKIKIFSHLLNNKGIKIFLPIGQYKILCRTLSSKNIILILNKKRYLCSQDKPISFLGDGTSLNINIAAKDLSHFSYLTINNTNNRYYKDKVYYVSHKNYFKNVKKSGGIYLENTHGRQYFYY